MDRVKQKTVRPARLIRTFVADEVFEAIRVFAPSAPRLFACLHCSRSVDANNWIYGIEMRRNWACFDCWFWLEKIDRRVDPNVARILGSHYTIGGLVPPPQRGFNGERFDIYFCDGRHVSTCNLWSQGRIPDKWKVALPDNASWEPWT